MAARYARGQVLGKTSRRVTPGSPRHLGTPHPRGGGPACTCGQGVLAPGQRAEQDREFTFPTFNLQIRCQPEPTSHRNEDAR